MSQGNDAKAGKTALTAGDSIVQSSIAVPKEDGASASMASALIMAGGRSSRMRTECETAHKALVPILGVPMLERNLVALFAAGFREITVSVSAAEPAVSDFLETRGVALGRAAKARIDTFLEHAPLGTIGAARQAIGESESLLVVNVDNITAIDLRAFVEHHVRSAAAMSVACHYEPFVMPFGEVRCDGDAIGEYVEKPVHRYLISSGTYVLSKRACASIEEGRQTGVPALIARLRSSGEIVGAFTHGAPWIDVNDAAAVVRAEALVANCADRFERLTAGVDRFAANLVIRSSDGVLVERASSFDAWEVPMRRLDSHEPREAAAVAAALLRERSASNSKISALASFDEYESGPDGPIRHFVFVTETSIPDAPTSTSSSRWIAAGAQSELADLGTRSRRCLAWAATTR